MLIKEFNAKQVSLIDRDHMRLVKLYFYADKSCHVILSIKTTDNKFFFSAELGVSSGEYSTDIMIPCVDDDLPICWEIASMSGEILWQADDTLKKPREWEFFFMVSSHTDIGLHNSQYHQRLYSSKFIDKAVQLCDKYNDKVCETPYRYTMEGRWFWENYPHDRGVLASKRIVEEYIHIGSIGVCGGIAGNHTNVFGLEELCRSAYGRIKLKRDWDIDTKTLSMIDNNGLSWAIVEPYAEAGYENIIFAPNHWNPIQSGVWYHDKAMTGHLWNSNAGGGGSRIDVRYDSALPMLFFYGSKSDDSKRLLVWASTSYSHGADEFGFSPFAKLDESTLYNIKQRFAERLPKMEARYPYDVWLVACYYDDQEPNDSLLEIISAWNEKWLYPKISMLGNPDKPFELVREKYSDKIPTLTGEITGGWYQHPLSASELLTKKLNTDRRLAMAETFSTIATLNADFTYPVLEFNRAWEYLLWNDEHSYGTSGYKGRSVHETWMQHRDWIDKATQTANTELQSALLALCRTIKTDAPCIIAFNSTANTRTERIYCDNTFAILSDIPQCGYKLVRLADFNPFTQTTTRCDAPPTVENEHYRIHFGDNGAMASIFDKELRIELLTGRYGANQFLFTFDNHRSMVSPCNASFTIEERPGVIRVVAEMNEEHSGAYVKQIVTLDSLHRRIDIENNIYHMRSMINNDRYKRYLYFAFPFDVPNARRVCQLNGCEAEYAKDLTGHSTDTYMSAHEWVYAENADFGVALFQPDTLLVEFDHIHPDKTDFGAAGDGSEIFSYVANDWLQMHKTGGSYVDYRVRYSICSWSNDSKPNIRALAENAVIPIECIKADKNIDGRIDKESFSFAQVSEGQRLVCLKKADDGEGVIARLYGDCGSAGVSINGVDGVACTIDERELSYSKCGFGFSSFRINLGNLVSREEPCDVIDESKPACIGSVWTGLITKPCAACGENDGMLYLLWGQNMEENLSHYELYRSKVSSFIPCEENHIADVAPGEYRVARYCDDGLEKHTTYYYRVRAVNLNGVKGDFSEQFQATTKE